MAFEDQNGKRTAGGGGAECGRPLATYCGCRRKNKSLNDIFGGNKKWLKHLDLKTLTEKTVGGNDGAVWYGSDNQKLKGRMGFKRHSEGGADDRTKTSAD